jgi:hypothetical protein
VWRTVIFRRSRLAVAALKHLCECRRVSPAAFVCGNLALRGHIDDKDCLVACGAVDVNSACAHDAGLVLLMMENEQSCIMHVQSVQSVWVLSFRGH